MARVICQFLLSWPFVASCWFTLAVPLLLSIFDHVTLAFAMSFVSPGSHGHVAVLAVLPPHPVVAAVFAGSLQSHAMSAPSAWPEALSSNPSCTPYDLCSSLLMHSPASVLSSGPAGTLAAILHDWPNRAVCATLLARAAESVTFFASNSNVHSGPCCFSAAHCSMALLKPSSFAPSKSVPSTFPSSPLHALPLPVLSRATASASAVTLPTSCPMCAIVAAASPASKKSEHNAPNACDVPPFVTAASPPAASKSNAAQAASIISPFSSPSPAHDPRHDPKRCSFSLSLSALFPCPVHRASSRTCPS
ncbi:hypothetical protein, conserved in T. vivax [Trypanosoma vivax Y486]|uniref:Uncharacterized protein n=1 Tax=Trypanosoma vivax (strain Y486) TaxID=1055687 RepID=F9WSQ4_TRYVY|nr:hypothetical protein, conserved in T. vivax [Trypanosoma vivax Y486]|eukprot:CCD20593.1 hypothetical protein, conserved in T. vivax [Trypanosoma vivax Y486]